MELTIRQYTWQSFTKTKQALGPLWLSAVFVLVSLVLLSLFRIGFSIWQFDRVTNIEQLAIILVNGLRIDLSTLSYLIAIPLLITIVSYFTHRLNSIVRYLIISWYTVALCSLIYLEVITPTFINEYDLRPNRLLIEYLVYPKEVSAMLWSGYKFEIAISLFALIITAYTSLSIFRKQWINDSVLRTRYKILVVTCALLITIMGARSSFGHRPLNPALVSFSTDHLLNDLTLNSGYSLAFAIKQMQLENSSSEYYGDLPQEKMLRIIKHNTNTPLSAFNDANYPTRAIKKATYQGKPKNIVILLQESLGARFVGGLGGLPLTPNLDALMNDGWNFTNLYATGTRSVRGIEAIITGFTPTPSRSVVKLDKSQREFFTIARLLKNNGYQTQFIYGGESHFDNMKSFFLGNGFEDIVDLEDFEKVEFEGSWGASDEDLYNQAHIELEKLQQHKNPFFSLVFTSSNHSPFEYPDGKISPFDKDKNTRNNAAKYADYALGQFMKKAKNSSYWQDTIFLIVADHDSRVAGASLVPIDHFRIPGVIIGNDISPADDNRLVSQIDLAPTLLSLAGITDVNPMLGHDLTKPLAIEKQRALMQYDKNFAYMTPNSVTILQPHKPPRGFSYLNKQLEPSPVSEKMVDRAKAHVLFGTLAYNKKWYQ